MSSQSDSHAGSTERRADAGMGGTERSPQGEEGTPRMPSEQLEGQPTPETPSEHSRMGEESADAGTAAAEHGRSSDRQDDPSGDGRTGQSSQQTG
jgi:hypothetical protein